MPGQTWEIEREPALTIGTGKGDDQHSFTSVLHATKLPDGRLLVADRGPARTIRVFGPDGHELPAWGGAGEGPGELSNPPWRLIPAPDGRVVVPEGMARVVNVFDSDGAFRERVQLRYEWEMYQPNAVQISACCDFREVLPDGTWLVAFPDQALTAGSGTRRGEQVLARLSPTGEWIGEFARIPGRLWRPGGRWDLGRLTYIPLTGSLATAVLGDEVFLGNGAEYVVSVFDVGGRKLRTLRLDREPPAFRDEWKDAFLESVRTALVRSMGEEDARRRTEAFGRTLPSQVAAYSQILASPGGRLWLVSPPIQGMEARGRTVIVIDREGHVHAEFTLPVGMRPFQVGPDWVLGAVEDSSGASHVVLHRLTAGR